ncbi:MAG: T9SS type A sorting domain-containing protein [bacterium]
MKPIKLLLVIALMGTFSIAQGLIIDHTSVDLFDQIPDQYLEAAAQLSTHYHTTSHGTQILAGLKYIKEELDAKYRAVWRTTYQSFPTPASALPSQTNPASHRIGTTCVNPLADMYWHTADGSAHIREYAASGLYNFSMFHWCGELCVSTDLTANGYLEAYVDTLDQFENDYTDMRFIYTTSHLDGNSYSKVLLNNQYIRDYCINNDKVLLDLGDIEEYDSDGNYIGNTSANCGWCQSYCEDNYSDCNNLPYACESGVDYCCAHAHGYNCYIKARAYWVMMAKLAGWGATNVKVKGKSEKAKIEINNYPNPIANSTRIMLKGLPVYLHGQRPLIKKYDLRGNLITQIQPDKESLVYGINWNTDNIPAGIYLIKVNFQGMEYNKQVVVIK